MKITIHPRLYTILFSAEETSTIQAVMVRAGWPVPRDLAVRFRSRSSSDYDAGELAGIMRALGGTPGYNEPGDTIYNTLDHALSPEFGTDEGLDCGTGTYDSDDD